MKPLVSCLMLTYNRLEFFKNSFQNFLDQTYDNKELIIVDSGDDDYKTQIDDIIKDHKNVKHIKVIRDEYKFIGDLRNESIKNASGDYCMTFDDDDIHHSLRIEKQMIPVIEQGYDATILRNFVGCIRDMKRNTVSNNMLQGLEPTLLYKNPKGKIIYTSINMGEDTSFINELTEKLKYKLNVVIDDFELYKYVYHGNNIVSEMHFIKTLKNMMFR